MKVLIVDDSRTVRRILRTVLEEAGFVVLEAENGRVALEQLDAHPDVGLTVTDWEMPEMDGVTLLRTLRDHPDYRSLPVLMVTQESRASHVREALEAGATEYLMKPFSRDMLLAKISALGCSGTPRRDARILVVDDSTIVRRVLQERLDAHPGLEFAGGAADGIEGLEQIATMQPDLVVLDVEMPRMGGIEMLAELRRQKVDVPVVMFSARTERGARETIQALTLGAIDYVTKPQGTGDANEVRSRIDEELLTLVTAILEERERPSEPRIASKSRLVVPEPEVVVIAASTGGPDVLETLLAPLPGHFPAPIVVAQHMPPIFTLHFARRLQGEIALEVVEGVDGLRLDHPLVVIAPGGQETTIVREHGVLVLRCNPTSHRGPKPSADRLFRSAANVCREKTLGIVLTGMGRDGMVGAAAISAARGRILVQDRETSVVSSMPRAVIETGVAEAELTPSDLAQALLEFTTHAQETQT